MPGTPNGPTTGLAAVEWNMEADEQNTAAMWDCHVLRLGINENYLADSLMFHLTPTGSACIKNVWLWTADHDLDSNNMNQVSVYVAGGMLVESVKPTCLYSTGSEHAVFYQYEFFAAMIQT
ncbi:hypothetical protein P885DRAFT_57674 [Corynascus similis CBS 632.67]